MMRAMPFRASFLAVALALVWAAPLSADVTIQVHEDEVAADDGTSAGRIQGLLDRLNEVEKPRVSYLAIPANSSNSPVAMGSSWGTVYFGASYQERTRYTDDDDGSVAVGFGVGDAYDSVGLDLGVSILGLQGDNAGDGSFSAKIHKALPNDFFVAVGVENAGAWGDTDVDESWYGAITKVFRLKDDPVDPFSRLTLTGGVGDGRFRREKEVINDTGDLGAFGSVSLRVLEGLGVFGEWTGQDMAVGASWVPFKDHAFVVTPAWIDILSTAGDGARFTIGASYAVFFRK